MTDVPSPDVFYFWDVHRAGYIGANGCCTKSAPKLFSSRAVCARALRKGGFYIDLGHILVCKMNTGGVWTWPAHIFLSDNPPRKRKAT